jgi:hypothetical protein
VPEIADIKKIVPSEPFGIFMNQINTNAVRVDLSAIKSMGGK